MTTTPVEQLFDTISDKQIQEFFSQDGPIFKMFPGYKPRSEQIALSAKIAHCFSNGKSLAADAPTGVGKSFAYLVPAFMYAKLPPVQINENETRPRRILVATSSIALMDQIEKTDLPFLSKLFPGISTSVLKGTSNYLCRSKYVENNEERTLDMTKEQIFQCKVIENWAEKTSVGDSSELSIAPDGEIWSRYSIAPNQCKSTQCRYFNECFVMEAKRQAMKAQIVITNYHLILTLASAPRGSKFLNSFDILVCDEAHHIADIARTALGFKVYPWTIASAIRKASSDIKKDVKLHSDKFFEHLRDLYSEEKSNRITKKGVIDSFNMVSALARAEADMREQMNSSSDTEQAKEYDLCIKAVEEIIYNLKRADALDGNNVVYYLEGGNSVSLCAALISPAFELREKVWKLYKSVIMTSATLATGGDQPFAHLKLETGIQNPEEIMVSSPFDYKNRCLLYIPDICDSQDAGFATHLAREIAKLIRITDGKVLCLHTSYKNLNAVKNLIKPNAKIPVLVQGEEPRAQLVKKFKEMTRGVLLGTDSFWTGVDVPGIRILIIDKLPFPNPGDPILEALQERENDSMKAFNIHSIPRAVFKFRQGSGRLIRRIDDYGVIAVMDNRLAPKSKTSKPYTMRFIKALPAMKGTRSIDEVSKWLENKNAIMNK
jgi:ATP-dependent DNA helicase DinG